MKHLYYTADITKKIYNPVPGPVPKYDFYRNWWQEDKVDLDRRDLFKGCKGYIIATPKPAWYRGEINSSAIVRMPLGWRVFPEDAEW